ncbi:MAG: NUDIX hydrolase [Chloroflexota bacterium]
MNTHQKTFSPPRLTLCVGAVVLHKNKILFVRQTYGGLKGKWSLPWGFVEGNRPDGSLEPPELAAIRETQEEAGVIVKVEGLLGIQNHSSRGEARLYIIFLCHPISGEPKPDNQETDKAAYFSLAEMADFNEPFDEFCEWIARRVLNGEHHVIPPHATNPYQPYLAFL